MHRLGRCWVSLDRRHNGDAEVALIVLPPIAQSVRAARLFAARRMDGDGSEVRDEVVLLVSELVTNAIQHGGPHGPSGSVGLDVELQKDRVRVTVTDSGTGVPLAGTGDDPSGRGLVLVETLATSWGWDSLPVGKAVWFEILIPHGRAHG